MLYLFLDALLSVMTLPSEFRRKIPECSLYESVLSLMTLFIECCSWMPLPWFRVIVFSMITLFSAFCTDMPRYPLPRIMLSRMMLSSAFLTMMPNLLSLIRLFSMVLLDDDTCMPVIPFLTAKPQMVTSSAFTATTSPVPLPSMTALSPSSVIDLSIVMCSWYSPLPTKMTSPCSAQSIAS